MKNNKGFSMIEIVVVLLILAILAAITWPSLSSYYRDSQDEIYLAEGEKVLTSVQVEVKKLLSKNGSLNDAMLAQRKVSILKRAGVSGDLIHIYTENNDLSFFCYWVEDKKCYVIYDFKLEEPLYISKEEIDKNIGT